MEEENEPQNSFCCVCHLCSVLVFVVPEFCSIAQGTLQLLQVIPSQSPETCDYKAWGFSLSNLACLYSMVCFDVNDYSHEIQLQFIKSKESVFCRHFSRNCSKAWYQTSQKQHSAWHPQQPRVPRILCSQQYASNHLPSSSVFPYPYPSYVCRSV